MIRARTIAALLYTVVRTYDEKAAQTFIKRAEEFFIARGQQLLFQQALQYVLRMLERNQEAETAHIETAHEVSARTLAAIQSFADANDREHVHTIDPELLGGFRITHNYRQHDATFEQQLEALKQTLV